MIFRRKKVNYENLIDICKYQKIGKISGKFAYGTIVQKENIRKKRFCFWNRNV